MSLPMKFKYTEEQLRLAIESSGSIRQVLSKLGLKEAGGNYETTKRRIFKLNIDTSHFHGQAHLKGKTHDYTKKPIEFYLTKNSHHQSYKLKLRLITEGIKTHKCECCGIIEWRGQPTPIELDHINGNHTDNRLENLRLLCPNCHAQTDTYRGKNKK
jgi:Zn finger protein HypA/HybF involved in hydrogenase expression